MMKWHTEKMPHLIAEQHAQISPRDPLIRSFRMTPDDKKLDDGDSVLANPHFNDSDTTLRACVLPVGEATMQVVSEAKDNMAGRYKVRVINSELRISCVFDSPFEIQHSSFSPSSNQSGEGDHRRALIAADLVGCMFALPGQLFYSTQPIEALAA